MSTAPDDNTDKLTLKQIEKFKNLLNEAYGWLPKTATLEQLAKSATDYKRQLAGRGGVSQQNIAHWVSKKSRTAPGTSPEANTRVPSNRDDVRSLVLALARHGVLRIREDHDEINYERAEVLGKIVTSLGYRAVSLRMLEEAARGHRIAELVNSWTRALDSSSPARLDEVFRHLLSDVLQASENEQVAGLLCVSAMSPPGILVQDHLIAAVVDFINRNGSYAIVVPFESSRISDVSRSYRTDAIRGWLDFVRQLRHRWSGHGIEDAKKRLKLVVPRSDPADASDSSQSAVTLAMQLFPPLLGEEARPMLVTTHTSKPPEVYKHRVAVMVRGEDRARRLTQRYPFPPSPIDKHLPVKATVWDDANDDQRLRAEVDCVAAQEFFAPVVNHWKHQDHKTLDGLFNDPLWKFLD